MNTTRLRLSRAQLLLLALALNLVGAALIAGLSYTYGEGQATRLIQEGYVCANTAYMAEGADGIHQQRVVLGCVRGASTILFK